MTDITWQSLGTKVNVDFVIGVKIVKLNSTSKFLFILYIIVYYSILISFVGIFYYTNLNAYISATKMSRWQCGHHWDYTNVSSSLEQASEIEWHWENWSMYQQRRNGSKINHYCTKMITLLNCEHFIMVTSCMYTHTIDNNIPYPYSIYAHTEQLLKWRHTHFDTSCPQLLTWR